MTSDINAFIVLEILRIFLYSLLELLYIVQVLFIVLEILQASLIYHWSYKVHVTFIELEILEAFLNLHWSSNSI